MAARTAPAWLEQKWKDDVTHRLQSKGFILKPALAPGGEIKAATVTWRRSDAGEATVLGDAIENVSSLNLGRDTVSATMVDYEANEYIRKRDLEKMSVNEQAEVAQTITMAQGRRFDRVVLRTLDAAAGAIPLIGDGTAMITPPDLMRASGELFSEASGGYQIWAAVPQQFLNQLRLFREFVSSDYIGDEYPLLKGIGARRWDQINIIPVPQHATNPLKQFFSIPSAGQADGYMWVEGAIGFESSNTLNINTDWVPEKKAWLVASDMAAACAVILPEGVRRLRFNTAAALTRPTP